MTFISPMPKQFVDQVDQSKWPQFEVLAWKPGNEDCACSFCNKPYKGGKMSSYCWPCVSILLGFRHVCQPMPEISEDDIKRKLRLRELTV